jgi:hypothetical protein
MVYTVFKTMFRELDASEASVVSNESLSIKNHSSRSCSMGAGGNSSSGGKSMVSGSVFPGVPDRVVLTLQQMELASPGNTQTCSTEALQ